jgi:hypothetical protein
MQMLKHLGDYIGGHYSDIEAEGTARQLRLILLAGVATILSTAIYGFAVGCVDQSLAFTNIFKLPMVVLLSGVAALPPGLLAGKLTESRMAPTDITSSLMSANMTGSLVLLSAAPVVALYYLSGSTFSAYIAFGAALAGEFVALWIFFRAAHKRKPKDATWFDVWFPSAVLAVVQIVAIIQLIGIASPILPEMTLLSQGMDGLMQ